MADFLTASTRVLLADDHQMLREGLRRLLSAERDIAVVAEVGTGFQLLETLRSVEVDVAVCDLSMPGPPAMELIKRIRSEFPSVAVLVLTMHGEGQYASRAFRCGANGYLTKECAGDQLVRAIRKVAAGGAYVSSTLAEHLALGLGRGGDTPRHELLTDREFEVYRHLAAGRRMTDIARQMHLSIKTVSTHKTRVLEKLGVGGLASLVRYSIEHGLFDETATDMQASSPPPLQMSLPLQAN